jgi:sterol desaturase/sphingolipid hydroxylase (fatty acid hydroxylase superfamily)
MSMNTTAAPTHHVVRVATLASLLTVIFAVSAWFLIAVGQFHPSVVVLVLAVSSFCASWVVTGHRHQDDDLGFVKLRTRIR